MFWSPENHHARLRRTAWNAIGLQASQLLSAEAIWLLLFVATTSLWAQYAGSLVSVLIVSTTLLVFRWKNAKEMANWSSDEKRADRYCWLSLVHSLTMTLPLFLIKDIGSATVWSLSLFLTWATFHNLSYRLLMVQYQMIAGVLLYQYVWKASFSLQAIAGFVLLYCAGFMCLRRISQLAQKTINNKVTMDNQVQRQLKLVKRHEWRRMESKTNPLNVIERLGGDEELAKEVILLFLNEHEKDMAQLQNGFAEDDKEIVKAKAHKLKGTLGNFGDSGALRHIKTIDAEVSQTPLQDLKDEMVKFENALEILVEDLKKTVESIDQRGQVA